MLVQSDTASFSKFFKLSNKGKKNNYFFVVVEICYGSCRRNRSTNACLKATNLLPVATNRASASWVFGLGQLSASAALRRRLKTPRASVPEIK